MDIKLIDLMEDEINKNEQSRLISSNSHNNNK